MLRNFLPLPTSSNSNHLSPATTATIARGRNSQNESHLNKSSCSICFIGVSIFHSCFHRCFQEKYRLCSCWFPWYFPWYYGHVCSNPPKNPRVGGWDSPSSHAWLHAFDHTLHHQSLMGPWVDCHHPLGNPKGVSPPPTPVGALPAISWGICEGSTYVRKDPWYLWMIGNGGDTF